MQENELTDLLGPLVLCYSPRLWDNTVCTNLAPQPHHSNSSSNLDGYTLAQPHIRYGLGTPTYSTTATVYSR